MTNEIYFPVGDQTPEVMDGQPEVEQLQRPPNPEPFERVANETQDDKKTDTTPEPPTQNPSKKTVWVVGISIIAVLAAITYFGTR